MATMHETKQGETNRICPSASLFGIDWPVRARFNEGMSSKPNEKPSKRLSLYGMKPEDALRKALSTPPPKTVNKTPKKG